MPKLLNRSARQVTIPYKDKNGRLHRVIFAPLQLVSVKTDDWKIMQKIFLVKKMIDNGELIEGAAANREAIDEDSLQQELEKDLTDEEKKFIEAS